MLNNFIYAQTKELFLNALENHQILDEAIVFIEDTKEIWNHGHYFAGLQDLSGYVTDEQWQSIANQINSINTSLDTKATKDELKNYATTGSIPTKVSQLTNDKSYLTKTDTDQLYATTSQHTNLSNTVSQLNTTVAAKLSSEDAAKTYATKSELGGKQDSIKDLATIRSGAALGATAVQPAGLNNINTSISNINTTIATLATKAELDSKLDSASAETTYVPVTRKINNVALDKDITITATDPNAATKDELSSLSSTVDTVKSDYLKKSDASETYAKIADVPTNNNQLDNGAGYITTNDANNAYAEKALETTVANQGTAIAALQAVGAEANVQSDWNAKEGDAFIKNKPDLSVYLKSSDAANTYATQTTVSGLDTKVGGVETALNNYKTSVSETYLTITDASNTYAKSDDSYTKQESDGKYLTSDALTPYATDQELSALNTTVTNLSGTVSTNTENIGKVSDRVEAIEDYFDGVDDVDDALNKWHEITDFLNGIAETEDLTSMLANKADQTALDQTNTDLTTLKQTIVDTTKDGLAPKADAADGTINSSTNDWVLTNKNGSIGWYKLPANAFLNDNTDTDTHYTTGLYIGANGAKSNAATINGNTYLKLYDDSTSRASFRISGSGATTVTSDENGNITISSTDTNDNTTYSAGDGITKSSSNAFSANLRSTTKDTLASTNAASTANRVYAVEMDKDGYLAVVVPWTDTNTDTKYTAGTNVSINASNEISATDTTYDVAKYNSLGLIKPSKNYTGAATLTTTATQGTTAPTINAITNTASRYYAVEMDKNGIPFVNVPWTDTNTDTNTTYAASTGLSLSNDNKFSLKTATTTEIGGIKASNVLTTSQTLTSSNGTTANRFYGVQVDKDGKAFVNVPWTDNDTTYTALKNPNSISFKDSSNTTRSYDGSSALDLTGGVYYAVTAGTASKANQLTTARTLWGQSFNGTANISGALTGVSSITMTGYIKMGDATISYDSTQKCIKFSF